MPGAGRERSYRRQSPTDHGGGPAHAHHHPPPGRVAATAALALIPATRIAATIQGGPGNERLRGTNAADLIDGNAGNDRILGRAGDDA